MSSSTSKVTAAEEEGREGRGGGWAGGRLGAAVAVGGGCFGAGVVEGREGEGGVSGGGWGGWKGEARRGRTLSN